MFDWFKKEKPFSGFAGFGGGATGLAGAGAAANGITASGGLVSDYTEGSTLYRAHIFTSTGTLVVTDLGAIANTLEYLVIAGGGSGGQGGGGAGGYRSSVVGQPSGGGGSAETALTVSAGPTTYTITVGGGGSALTAGVVGNSGVDSACLLYTSDADDE